MALIVLPPIRDDELFAKAAQSFWELAAEAKKVRAEREAREALAGISA